MRHYSASDLRVGILGILLTMAAGQAAHAQCESAMLFASDGSPHDRFGMSISFEGDRMLVGAPGADADMPTVGAGYLFEWDGTAWVELAKMTANVPTYGSSFGSDVSLSGDYALISAWEEDGVADHTGAAYIFRNDPEEGWVQDAHLTAADPDEGDLYGLSLALVGDLAVIGNPYDDDVFDGAGSIDVYRNLGGVWAFEAELHPDTPQEFEYLGRHVATDGQRIVTKGKLDTVVFLFDNGTWIEETRLPGRATSSSSEALSIGGDLIVIGDAWADVGDVDRAGKVHVFRYVDGTWTPDGVLTTRVPFRSGKFGWSVHTDGTTILVGTYLNGIGRATVSVFQYDGISWIEQELLIRGQDFRRGYFAESVASNGVTIATSAPHQGGTELLGALYLFDFDLTAPEDCNGNLVDDVCELAAELTPDCNDNGQPDDCDIADGTSEDCNWNGVPDECDPDCNENDYPDACDIAFGFSLDCNGNGIPDECEPDCNENDVPDDCDISFGTSFDCNENGIPDECETDCNENGYADECDIADGTSEDCNGNGIPDECETDCNENGIPDDCDIADGTSTDDNGNGIPDECECPDVPLGAPVAGGTGTNRYISFTPGNSGFATALRVTITDAGAGFESMIGRSYWVGQPRAISETAGASDDIPPTFMGANLGCTPRYVDWGAIGMVHVFDDAIIPGLSYEVQAIARGCELGCEDDYSPAMPIATTALWGDITSAWNGSEWGMPDGVIDFTDISVVVDKFRNLPNAPSKARTDLAGELPDAVIDFTDVSWAVEAFRNTGYPFALPPPCE